MRMSLLSFWAILCGAEPSFPHNFRPFTDQGISLLWQELILPPLEPAQPHPQASAAEAAGPRHLVSATMSKAHNASATRQTTTASHWPPQQLASRPAAFSFMQASAMGPAIAVRALLRRLDVYHLKQISPLKSLVRACTLCHGSYACVLS